MAVSDMKKQGRSWLVSGGLIAVGAIAGYLLPHHSVAPAAEVGTVTSVSPAADSQTKITFRPDKGKSQEFQVYTATTRWQATPSGDWKTGSPPCLTVSKAKPGKVTLGVITVQQVDSAPAGMIIAWVECYA